MARSNTGRIMVIVLGPLFRNHQSGGAIVGRSALGVCKGRIDGRARTAAEETEGGLLPASKSECSVQTADGAIHQAAIITPGPRDPRAVSPLLITQLRGLLERLIVVDAERSEERRV